jgi:hypothetical protein
MAHKLEKEDVPGKFQSNKHEKNVVMINSFYACLFSTVAGILHC